MNALARTHRALFWTLAGLGFGLDLATKYAVFAWLERGEHREFVPRVFSLVHQPNLNRGALFGFANHAGDLGVLSNLAFAGVSCLAIAGIVYWMMRPGAAARDAVLSASLGLILGGAAGNLYDRIVFGGVRDFLWVYYHNPATGEYPFNFPVFNIADSCLVCGAGLILAQALFAGKSSSQPAEQPKSVGAV